MSPQAWFKLLMGLVVAGAVCILAGIWAHSGEAALTGAVFLVLAYFSVIGLLFARRA